MEQDLETLAEELTTLAAHVSAATCRWLELVAVFDERRGWAEWGCTSCAQWISWRCSIGPVAAREHVRVARRLQDLPLVRAAFARGELSYSKVRAVARIGEVEREEDVLELALTTTAAQLERVVRAHRKVEAVETAHAEAHRRRFLSFQHDDDGALVLRGRLPAEEGALVLAALEAARDALWRDAQADPDDSAEAPATGEDAAEPDAAPPPSNADGLIVLAEAFAAAGSQLPEPARAQVLVHVDMNTLAGGDGATVGLLDDGEPLPAETVRRLCCDAAIVPMAERARQPLSVGRRSRTVPSALRRALHRRDGGCRFPGCQQRRHVDAHHIRHWAHGGETSADNLVLLCRRHHRLVHEAGYRLGREGRRLVFRRPDGRRLCEVPRPRRGDAARLADDHRRAGLRIDAQTSVPRWWGERLELDHALAALLVAAPVREAPGV